MRGFVRLDAFKVEVRRLQDHRDELRHAIAAARSARKHTNSSIYPELVAIARTHRANNDPLSFHESSEHPGNYIKARLADVRDDAAVPNIALFLEWLCRYCPTDAEVFYRSIGNDFPNQFRNLKRFPTEESDGGDDVGVSQQDSVPTPHDGDRDKHDAIPTKRQDRSPRSWQPTLWLPDTRLSQENWLNPFVEDGIPFVGREHEQASLTEFATCEDIFRIWAVSGPSGAGKTRLVTHWMRAFQKRQRQQGSDEPDWSLGFLRESERDQWNDWSPAAPTLIVIDYISLFKDDIEALIRRFSVSEPDGEPLYSVRLLLIDHIFPADLADIVRDPRLKHITTRGVDWDDRQSMFFCERPLSLAEQDQPEPSLAIIMKLGAKQGGDVPSDDIVTSAMVELRETVGAWCPLFAALRGRALATDSALRFSERRTLIQYYLDTTNRLPWSGRTPGDQQDGLWTGCFIAVATAFRGVPFRRLIGALPAGLIESDNAIDRVSAISVRSREIVSTFDDTVLAPFEPDILGESFFLELLCHITQPLDRRLLLASMLQNVSDSSDPWESAREFVGFLDRLIRNLGNDDQNDKKIRRYWRALLEFLSPPLFDAQTALRQAVTISQVTALAALREHGQESIAGQAIVDDTLDDLLLAVDGPLESWADIALMQYYDLLKDGKDGADATDAALATKLSTLEDTFRPSSNRTYPLAMASHYGLKAVVDLLLSKAANVNQVAHTGHTALELALAEGHEAVALQLIEAGADVNRRIDAETTPLLLATLQGMHSAVERLIEKGAVIDSPDEWSSPLNVASERGDLDIVTLLLEKGADPDRIAAYSGGSALMWASINGHRAIARALIDASADVNAASSDHKSTPLHLASEKAHADIVKLLIERSADVDKTNVEGATPLVLAILYGSDTVARILIENGADVDKPTELGWTPLLAAIHKDREAIAELLIAKGADVNRTLTNGVSPLMAASMGGNDTLAAKLINAGADVNAFKFDDGATALAYATLYDHPKVIRLLTEKGAATFPEGQPSATFTAGCWMMAGSLKGDEPLVKLMIEAGANPDFVHPHDGGTALDRASYIGHLGIAAYLLESGADIDKANRQSGRTALMLASMQGHSAVVDLLVRKGANRDQTSHTGATALDFARNGGHHDVVAILLGSQPGDEREPTRNDRPG